MPSMAWRKSSGSSRLSTMPRNVRLGSAFDRISGARDLGAVLQRDAGRAAGARVDARDGRVGADLRAEPLRGLGHRAGDRAHAADHVPVEPLDVVVAAGQQVEQQPDRRPRLVRPAVLAVHVVRQVQRLHLVRLEVAVQVVAQAPGQERDHLPDLVAVDAAEPHRVPQRLDDPRRDRARGCRAAAPGSTAAGSAPASSARPARAERSARPVRRTAGSRPTSGGRPTTTAGSRRPGTGPAGPARTAPCGARGRPGGGRG